MFAHELSLRKRECDYTMQTDYSLMLGMQWHHAEEWIPKHRHKPRMHWDSVQESMRSGALSYLVKRENDGLDAYKQLLKLYQLPRKRIRSYWVENMLPKEED